MKRVTLQEKGIKTLNFQVPKMVTIEGHQMQATLDVKFELDFNAGIGRGGTCLVYHAYQIVEFAGGALKHKVILKEFYPVLEDEGIEREEDGSLLIPERIAAQDLYQRKFKRFQHSYELFVGLHNESDTNNYIIDADALMEGNGTWYLVADYNEACSLSEYMEKQPNLHDFCLVMKRTVEAVSHFHKMGYLHLDLTPGNIMVFKDQYVRIMDTDSLLKKDEIRTERPALSWSEGYAAPELFGERIYQRLYKMGERSDIFSIGAIFYRYLFGERLDILAENGELNRAKMNRLLTQYSYESRLQEKLEEKYGLHQQELCKCPQNAVRMIQELLRLLLAEKMPCRYASMQEAAEAIEVILPLVEPKGVQILDNFRKNTDAVYGREEKLTVLQNAFEAQGERGKHRLVMIFGIGGIGKSTLARAYGEKYLEQYETIVEVTAESAKDAIKSITITNFESDSFEERVQLLQNLLHEGSCLLIVHDYNQREDDSFGLWKELPCDVLLTGWGDWKESDIACLELKRHDLTEQAAIDIFKEIYLKSAQTEAHRLERMLKAEGEALKELMWQAEYHPLTIKLLAKQMTYMEGAEQTPSQMLAELEQSGIKEYAGIEFQNQKDGGKVELGDTYFHLQKIYGTALRQGRLSAEELEVLRFMTLLTGETGICRERFVSWTGLGEDAEKILVNLHKKGWIEYEPQKTDDLWQEIDGKNAKGTYHMPMCIAQVLYRQEQLISTMENSDALIGAVHQIMGRRLKHYTSVKSVLDIAENLCQRIKEEQTEEYAWLLNTCGYEIFYWAASGIQMETAIKYMEKAFRIRLQQSGKNHRGIYSSYCSLAYVSYWNAEYEKALRYCEQALKIVPKTYFDNGREAAGLYDLIGNIYLAMGQHEEAVKFIEKSYDSAKTAALGMGHTDWGRRFQSLGAVEAAEGNYFWAIEFWEMARAEYVGPFAIGEDRMEVADLDFDLAFCYWECGWKSRAIDYLKHALVTYEQFYGKEIGKTVTTRQMLMKYQQEFEEQKEDVREMKDWLCFQLKNGSFGRETRALEELKELKESLSWWGKACLWCELLVYKMHRRLNQFMTRWNDDGIREVTQEEVAAFLEEEEKAEES